MLPGRPTDFDTIGRGDPLASGLEVIEAFEMFIGEESRIGTVDPEPQECEPAVEERHRGKFLGLSGRGEIVGLGVFSVHFVMDDGMPILFALAWRDMMFSGPPSKA